MNCLVNIIMLLNVEFKNHHRRVLSLIFSLEIERIATSEQPPTEIQSGLAVDLAYTTDIANFKNEIFLSIFSDLV